MGPATNVHPMPSAQSLWLNYRAAKAKFNPQAAWHGYEMVGWFAKYCSDLTVRETAVGMLKRLQRSEEHEERTV